MSKRGLALLVGALACAALGAGCTSAQKGAVAGGAVGGAAGAILGYHAPVVGGMARGAIIGASSGAAVGGLAGDAYDQITEGDLEREADNLRAELAEREAELAALRAQAPNSEEVAALQRSLDDLRAALEAREAAIAALEENNRQLASRNEQLDFLNERLDEANRRLAEANERLGARGAELAERNAAIEKLNKELEAARDALEKALRERDDATNRSLELEDRVRGLSLELEEAESNAEEARRQASLLRTSLDGKAAELAAARRAAETKQAEMERLGAQLADMNVQMEQTSRGITLTIAEQLLYQPGKAELTPAGAELVGKVARILRTNFPNNEFVVEGHTDNQPIRKSGWRSNWELSSARALSVVHELVNAHGFDPRRLSATSYGEYDPIADNGTAAGRAKNRRAVILVLPENIHIQRQQLAGAR